MPSEFPRSPRLLKGALVVFAASVPIPTNLIVFQYNPETMTRSFQPVAGGGDPSSLGADTQHVAAPPIESFQVAVELDAADQLETSDPLAQAVGLHPTLAALELLLYPSSTQLILNRALAQLGSAIVTPSEVPMVLLVWGAPRVIPVRITSLGITEQAYDPLLNPIRARVALGFRALTEPELRQAGPPFDTLALVNHIGKEVLSRGAAIASAQHITRLLPF